MELYERRSRPRVEGSVLVAFFVVAACFFVTALSTSTNASSDGSFRPPVGASRALGPRQPLVVLAGSSDPYRPLAVEISAEESAPLADTVEEAVALAPDFLIWVVSPAALSDQALVAYGRAVERTNASVALGFISGSTIARARALWHRPLLPGNLRIAHGRGTAAEGVFRSRAASIRYAGGARSRVEPLTIDTFREALRLSDAATYEGHGAQTHFRFDERTLFSAGDVPSQTPGIVSTYACNTFRIWTPRSIALAFTDRETAAYVGYAYSPLPGYQMVLGYPFGSTWPAFPIGRLVELQSAASTRGLFAFPVYHLLGDPRLSVRKSPPYRVVSDRLGNRDRVIDLAPLPADLLPIRIDGGARYETTEVAGVARVWRDDPFYNGRLQVLDAGGDRYLLVQHPGGPVTIRLSDDRPVLRTAAEDLLKALDLSLLVYPASGRGTCAVATGLGLAGLAWTVLRRHAALRATLAAIVLGGVVAAGHFGYSAARAGRIDAISSADWSPSWPPDGSMFAATWALAAWGALRFARARAWPGKSLALAVGGLLIGWGPVIVWLGWPLVFNRMVIARIGSPLYNYRPGLLALIAALAFTVFLAAAFSLGRRFTLLGGKPTTRAGSGASGLASR